MSRHKELAKILSGALALLCLGLGSARAERIFEIKSRIISRGPVVRLDDALINTGVLAEGERRLVLVDHAEEAGPKLLTLVELAYLMRRHETLRDAMLRGPRRIVVTRGPDPRQVQLASSEIVRQIRLLSPWSDWECEVHFTPDDESRISRIGAFDSLKVLHIDNRAVLGNVALRVAFLGADGERLGEASVNPLIVRQVQAVVLGRAVEPGDILGRDDLQMADIWVGADRKSYAGDMAECVGRELKRQLGDGEVLRREDLVNPVCARRGDRIWLTCRTRGISVQLSVTARESGRLRDWIRVENPASNKSFEVELVGDKQAVLEIGG